MIVRMLTRLNSNRDLVSAYQVISHTDVIEIPTLLGFLARKDPKFYPRLGQLSLHRGEFLGARDPKTQVRKIVAAVGVQDDPMMLIIHPQIATIGFAVVHQFHANYTSREI